MRYVAWVFCNNGGGLINAFIAVLSSSAVSSLISIYTKSKVVRFYIMAQLVYLFAINLKE